MIGNVVYLVDENEQQRRAFGLVLNELFANTGLAINGIEPLPAREDYAKLVADEAVVAMILDQKMEDGGIPYSGTELSSFLRGIVPKLPIYILSNYTEDRALFERGEGAVEDIISKKAITDPVSRDAQIFKSRFLRRLGGYADVVDERASRYHELLVKSLREELTPEEVNEMGLLDVERLIPQHAGEIQSVNDLNAAIEELQKRLNGK